MEFPAFFKDMKAATIWLASGDIDERGMTAQFSSDVERTRKAMNLAGAVVRSNFFCLQEIGSDEEQASTSDENRAIGSVPNAF